MQQHRNEKKKMKAEVTSAHARPNCGGTSPSGHLYSRATSIQGTQNLAPEKCSTTTVYSIIK